MHEFRLHSGRESVHAKQNMITAVTSCYRFERVSTCVQIDFLVDIAHKKHSCRSYSTGVIKVQLRLRELECNYVIGTVTGFQMYLIIVTIVKDIN